MINLCDRKWICIKIPEKAGSKNNVEHHINVSCAPLHDEPPQSARVSDSYRQLGTVTRELKC